MRLAPLLLLLLASAAIAQTPPAPPVPPDEPTAVAPPQAPTPPTPAGPPIVPAAPATPLPDPAGVRVVLVTADGPITIELAPAKAPVTAANFLKYVDQKKLDGASFYRAMKLSPAGDFGLIQGGPRGDPKRSLPPIAHEPTSKTGLSHTDGAISMARGAPGSATGEFFIIVGNLSSLDADPAKSGDNAGYAVFGRVVDGMDVVRKILLAPTSPTAGEGVMKGQMLEPTVKIISARRVRPAS